MSLWKTLLRHQIPLWVLACHAPVLLVVGLLTGRGPAQSLLVALPPAIAVAAGQVLRAHRRTSSVTVAAGLGYCSSALVALTDGAIAAQVHFIIIIGFVAYYQDWARAADSRREQERLVRQLDDTETGRRQSTSDLLTNLARRNQSLLYRQLEIIHKLAEEERDPAVLAELSAVDHLATRVRRGAENLLVLSGEKPPRTGSSPVALRDVLRAAVAETEDPERIVTVVDEQTAVLGHVVTDLTHLIAELTENAVRFSPPHSGVTVRCRPDRTRPRGLVITVEDAGVGMPEADLDAANALLGAAPEVDLAVSQRLGLHVIARLGARHGVDVSLRPTPGAGLTAVVMLPPPLFAPHGIATRELRSSARPLPVLSTVRPAGSRTTRGGLRQRIPQSHLSDELRDLDPRPVAASGDALSRYRATRAAAQAADEDHDRRGQ